MSFETKNGFGLSSLAGGDSSSFFRSSLPLVKRVPIFPQKYYGLDYSYSNRETLRPACTACFASPNHKITEHYVDLLQFSNFGGVPTPLCSGVNPPSRWFADIRYSLATPLPHFYPSVGHEVLNSLRLSKAIKGQVDAGCTSSVYELKRRARHFFNSMRASLSRFVCKICGYLLFKVFRRLISHLLISPEQIKRLQEANATGLPLVYLPLHKSHLDYLMITWTAWHFSLPLPHIASGDNLNLSGLGWLLRATGAFFIHRRTDPNDTSGQDAIYRAVLHSYIEQLMSHGLPIEFFLEGTRSRFGKSLIPKHGLISNIVEAYQEGMIKDCYLVPVSYTYENVPEGIFLEELMGVPKVRESVFGVFRGVLKGFRSAKRCGAVRMHFAEPIQLSNLLSALRTKLSYHAAMTSLARLRHSFSYRELIPWQIEHEQQIDNRTMIRAIGYHIVYEAQSMVSISLPSVVSALLLCKFNMGISEDVLASDIEWLCNQIIADGSDVMGWNDSATCGSIALDHALKFIGSSVEVYGSHIEPRRTHRHLMNLAYHKNALVPLLAVKSAIALVLVSQAKDSLSVQEILDEASLICDWLQFEVIFSKPCVSLRDKIRSELGKLCSSGGPLIVKNSDDDEIFQQTEICPDSSHISIKDSNANHVLLFYSNMLRPFMQALYMIADKLQQGDVNERESHFIRTMCREYLATANKQPFDVLLEAINSDSFKNSIQVLREKKIICNDSNDIRVLEKDQLEPLKIYLLSRLKVFQFV